MQAICGELKQVACMVQGPHVRFNTLSLLIVASLRSLGRGMRKEGTYGDHIELKAWCHVRRTPLKVYSWSTITKALEIHTIGIEGQRDKDMGEDERLPCLLLVHEHYWVLERLGERATKEGRFILSGHRSLAYEQHDSINAKERKQQRISP